MYQKETRAMWGGGFVKHAVNTVKQQRRERKDRHDLHELQYGSEYRKRMDITHVDFSHLSLEEIELTRKNIQERYHKRRRRYVYLLILIFGLLSVPLLYAIWLHQIFAALHDAIH